MLSDSDVACVTIALALCLVHEKKRRWIKEWHKLSLQHARARTHTRLGLSEPNDYKILSYAIRRSIM